MDKEHNSILIEYILFNICLIIIIKLWIQLLASSSRSRPTNIRVVLVVCCCTITTLLSFFFCATLLSLLFCWWRRSTMTRRIHTELLFFIDVLFVLFFAVYSYSCIRGIRRFSWDNCVFIYLSLQYRRMCGSTVDGTVILEEMSLSSNVRSTGQCDIFWKIIA